MRFEWLFLRWLVVIGLGILGLTYALSWRQKQEAPGYQKVLLLQGAKSFELPLAGIAVDPERREVYGVLGRGSQEHEAPEFFILWKASNGRGYGVSFLPDGRGPSGICEILPGGDVRTLHEFRANAAAIQNGGTETPDRALRSVLAALPHESDIPGKY